MTSFTVKQGRSRGVRVVGDREEIFTKKIYENLGSNFEDMVYLPRIGKGVVTDSNKNCVSSIDTFGNFQVIFKGKLFFGTESMESEKIAKLGENEILVYGCKRAVVLEGVVKKRFRQMLALEFNKLFDLFEDELVDLKYLGSRRIVILTKRYILVVWISRKNLKIVKKMKVDLVHLLGLSELDRFEKLAVLEQESIITVSVQKMMKRSKIVVLRLTEKFEIEVLKTLKHRNSERILSTLMPFDFVFDVKGGSVMLESRLSNNSTLYSNLLSYSKSKSSYDLVPFLKPINRYLDTQNLKLAKFGNCCWNIDIKGNLSKLEIVDANLDNTSRLHGLVGFKKSKRKKLKIF